MTPNEGRPAGPNYNLGPDELSTLEAELVDVVRLGAHSEGVTAVWLGPEHQYANIIRTHEARLFPEVHDSSSADEDRTLFLALVDTRPASSGVVHGATVCGAGARDEAYLAGADGTVGAAVSTGFITIDSLIDFGNFTAEEFASYYAARNIDLTHCLSVETNFRIGQPVPNVWGLSTSTIAYLMVFRFLVRIGARRDRAVVFADVNRASRVSLQSNGIIYTPLMGRTDLVTPEAALGRSSLPVALPVDDALHDLFLTMHADVPQLFLGSAAAFAAAGSQASGDTAEAPT